MPLKTLLIFRLIVLIMLTLNISFADNFYKQLSHAAMTLTKDRVVYDPAYFSIPYPNGDIPSDKGVCTDVIIRAYRTLNIDLQKNVHEDMKRNFALYPKIWDLKTTDRNIDHRRVPNLRLFFSRFGDTLPVTKKPDDYLAGDIVSWELSSGVPHIGIVSDQVNAQGVPLIVHNIGGGQVLEDMLFDFKITGHYRYK